LKPEDQKHLTYLQLAAAVVQFLTEALRLWT
jgi:hypothetical protein